MVWRTGCARATFAVVEAPARDRLGSLTGLRFLAALAILLYHYGGPLLSGAPAWAERVRTGGHAWVGLFYVLSGFVLARANPEPMGSPARRAFWIARFARLYPAYLLAFVLVAPFALARWTGAPHAGAKAAVVATASVLMLQAWAPPIARLWNAPGWSTSVIAAFYAVFPSAAGRLSRLSRRGLLLALAAAWLSSLALPIAWLALRPDGTAAPASWTWGEPRWLEALKFHPFARAGEFLAGVALGLLARRGLALGRGAGIAAGGAIVAAAAILAWGAVPYPLLHNGLLVPLWGAVILGLARGEGLLARLLASAPARALGDASFALYALQEPLWLWARHLAGDPPGPASPAFVVGFSLVAVGISVAVSNALERPARRALRAVLAGAGRVRPAPERKPSPRAAR